MAEAAQRERWGHTVRVVQGAFEAFGGSSPPAEKIAPPGLFRNRVKKPTPEQEEAASKLAWDRLFAAVESGALR